jgi:hypothetical protein
MGNLEDQQSACHVAKVITCLAKVSHYLFAWLKIEKRRQEENYTVVQSTR